MTGLKLIESLREMAAFIAECKAGIYGSPSEDEQTLLGAADALSDRDARIAALEAGFRIIAEGTVSSGQDGHYLAHRYAVKIARALLTPTGTEKADPANEAG
jgi:hypothetical protein